MLISVNQLNTEIGYSINENVENPFIIQEKIYKNKSHSS